MPERGDTMVFRFGPEEENKVSRILRTVYEALAEKGYNPVNQIVGYLLSGDPTYITGHKGARNLIRTVERDELLAELVSFYVSRSQSRG